MLFVKSANGIWKHKLCSFRLLFREIGSTPTASTCKKTLFVNPDPHFVPTLTNLQLLDKFTNLIGASKQYGSPATVEEKLESRRKLMGLLPKTQEELPARRMQDSFISAIIPVNQNRELKERYTTYFGTVRVGRLLEDLDVFAAWCCYNHIKNPKAEGYPNPYSCVTALVDTIHFSGDIIDANKDIRMSGHVSWVGKSSMEVSVLVDQQLEPGSWKKLTSAVFVFVARDPLNQGSAIINPLVADTPEEAAFIALGTERSIKRKRTSQESLFLKPPVEEEREVIHNLFMSTLNPNYCGFHPSSLQKVNHIQKDSNMATMEDSRLNTLLLCHPQYRNRFNKIFGGFIMRQAFELAFSNVYLYTKTRPKIINIDDILFRKPVEIGSILRFGAEIGYVEDNFVHTPVIAEVMDPESGKSDVTNIFHFTFRVDSPPLPPLIMPHTYQESMMYLNARRHFKEMMNQRME